MAYVKLFESILASTIWAEPTDTRIVWVTMLAMADRDGNVQASVPGLAHFARVSEEACKEALASFMRPDKNSRTKTNEGRRIVEVDGGWLVLNYEEYRDRLDYEEKKEKDRLRQQRKRERDAAKVSRQPVTQCHAGHGESQKVASHSHSDSHSHPQSQVQKKTPRAAALGSSNKPPKLIEAAKPAEVPQGMWDEWRALRGPKKLVTERVLSGIEREAGKAGISVTDALAYTLESSWLSFKAAWYEKAMRSGGTPKRRVADGGDWTGNSEPIQEI